MIIAIPGENNADVRHIVEVLTESGFKLVDLGKEVPDRDGLVDKAVQAWGWSFRARLVADAIDPLNNALVTGVRWADEIAHLSRRAPTGVIDPSGFLNPGQISKLKLLRIPVDSGKACIGRDDVINRVMEIARGLPRVSWDEYFMRIARIVAGRSDCVKRKVAAIIVRDRRIIATGYNGAPKGTTNCGDGGCPRCARFTPSGTALDECLCSHGEENAITQAAYHGISVKGAGLYCTHSPCLTCTKMIINSGVTAVVFNAAYPLGESSLDLLAEAGVTVRQYGTG